MPEQGFKGLWCRKLTELFGIDLRSLALLRIAMAIMVIADLYWRASGGDLRVFYTDWGLLPRYALLKNFSQTWYMSFHLASGTALVQWILFGVHFIFALMLLAGYRTRLANFFTWLLLISIHTRNPLVFAGDDGLLRMMLFWSLFLPLGARYSVDSTLYLSSKKLPNQYFSWGTFALLAQVVLMWVFSSLIKSGSEWRNGTAIYYVLNIESFTTPLAPYLLKFPAFLKTMTYSTVLIEKYAWLLFFIPVFNGLIRTAAVVFFACFILSFRVGIEVGLFTWVCLTGLIPFLPPWFWGHLLAGFHHREKPALKIYYDDRSGFIKNSVRLMHTFLLRTKTEIIASQANPELEAERRTHQSCLVVERNGQRYYAVLALWAILRDSPLLWWLAPVLRWLPIERTMNQLCAVVYQQVTQSTSLSREIPVRPYSLGPRWWTHTLPLILIVYVFFWNAGTVQGAKYSLPVAWRWLGIWLQLDQKWNMFAPIVYKADGWYVMPGRLRDGSRVDVFRKTKGVTWEKPKLISRMYRSQRWRKYMSTLHLATRQNWRVYFAQYLCREWNGTHEGLQQLEIFDIYYMRELTQPPGEAPELKKFHLWKHDCFTQQQIKSR